MKTKKKLLATIIGVSLFMSMMACTVYAGVPMMLNYQGYLADTDGNPVSSTVKMTFKLYNTSAGGSALWTETHNSVTVNQGIFNVVLGSLTNLTESLFEQELYLGIAVGSDSEMTPRRRLASTAYAIRAKSVENGGGTFDGYTKTDLGGSSTTSSSGASKIGVYDEFNHSSATNLQDILDDFDEAISASPASGVWQKNPSGDIYYTDGNVGIGTTTPTAKLHVDGNIKANNIGSVFTRWGNGECPGESELLYTGFAFGDHYTHGGGSAEPTCLSSGDLGEATSSVTDILYPLGTHNTTNDMPPGIIEKREIKCAKCYVESPVFEMWGTSTCPRGWTAAYTGYGMGAHYKHGKGNRKCVDNVDFDFSVMNDNWGAIWYGSVVYNNADVGTYETGRFVKCAVCIKE